MSQGRYSTGIKFVLCKTSHWKFLPVTVPKTILPSLYNFKLRVPLLLSLISIFNELNSLKFSSCWKIYLQINIINIAIKKR